VRKQEQDRKEEKRVNGIMRKSEKARARQKGRKKELIVL
jgi:hypothetical protein